MNYIIMPGLRRNANGKSPIIFFSEKKDKICKLVCEYFGCDFENIERKNRQRGVVYPRHVCIYLLKNNTKLSLKSIGEIFNQDHTTVIHALNTVQNLMYSDPMVREDIRRIQESISI